MGKNQLEDTDGQCPLQKKEVMYAYLRADLAH